ncbi:hypothetical protein [Allonocardiopsis opalescens]|uniref:Uncharacterized protein n=1 Tax=Allonocardiopsis opalescens TaxID=1144618 RepID=A0A2T0PSR7_9ACTN|nr:hypothetical protein [Allonocardiopsis opalescens]PRX91947.1 hypothetical protein CLV72_11220 [Allonocardiopsis opalescens]
MGTTIHWIGWGDLDDLLVLLDRRLPSSAPSWMEQVAPTDLTIEPRFVHYGTLRFVADQQVRYHGNFCGLSHVWGFATDNATLIARMDTALRAQLASSEYAAVYEAWCAAEAPAPWPLAPPSVIDWSVPGEATPGKVHEVHHAQLPLFDVA